MERLHDFFPSDILTPPSPPYGAMTWYHVHILNIIILIIRASSYTLYSNGIIGCIETIYWIYLQVRITKDLNLDFGVFVGELNLLYTYMM